MENIRFNTTINEKDYKEIVSVQQEKVSKEFSYYYLFVFVPLSIVCLYWVYLNQSLNSLLTCAVCILIVLYCLQRICFPTLSINLNQKTMMNWFKIHGVQNPTKDNLNTTYTTTLSKYGYTLDSDTSHINVPWNYFTGNYKQTRIGTIFTINEKRNASQLYDKTYLHKEEAILYTLVIPKEELEFHKDLETTIQNRILTSKEYTKDTNYQAWMNQTKQVQN